MNKYNATIKVKGQSIRTTVFADSSIHARLMLQYQFGMDCILSSPILSTKEDIGHESLEEIIKRIQPIKLFKPLTSQQARVDNLKKQKERASKALDAERSRQKLAKDQQRIFNLSRP